MSYYNPNAYGLGASVSENLQPIVVPPVNRYLTARGLELGGSISSGNQGIHTRINHAQYIPLVVDTTSSYDRIGLSYVGANSCVSTWYYDLALYSGNATDQYPASKIADLGTITIDPASTPTGAQLVTINQELTANTLYFIGLGVRFNNNTDFLAGRTPWLVQQQGNYQMFNKRGIGGVTSNTCGISWFVLGGTYAGTMPTTPNYTTDAPSPSAVTIRLPLRRSA